MSVCGVKILAGWAGLLMLAAAGSSEAFADGAVTPASPDASLGVAPPVTKTPSAGIDNMPTGALRPQALPFRSSRTASRLDLTPPPGLLPDLPPEAPPPSLLQSAIDAPAAVSNVSTEAPAAGRFDDLQPSPPSTGAPAAPDATAPPAGLQPSQALAGAIHEALDRFVSVKPAGRPIGAGDWDAARQAIAAVYAERGNAPLWIEGNGFTGRAKAALARLARADDDGLDLSASPAPSPDLRDATPETLAQVDVALSAAVVAYAMEASGARIVPGALFKDASAKPEVADPGTALKSVAAAEDPDDALAAFNPPQPGYRALRAALADLRSDAAKLASNFAPGPVLKLGMSDPRVPLIRARFGLGAMNDPTVSRVYDVRVASAVAAFQRVHGLPPNGALTEATASALDGGGALVRRERLIIANMEMWRWEPPDLGKTRVEVNVPDFSLKLTSGDAVLFRARVIVGKPDTPTPIFSNSIKYMLFNPVWRVPDSIIKKEMAPKLVADPDYFERHGYKVSYAGDKMVVEQPPGEANALGRMLFLFPNEHAVYLHDTPTRSLFSASYRALSHGCVRVEDPARLAEILMGGAARGWTTSKVNSLLGDKERTFSLPTPTPVHLQYFTEFVGEGGKLQERADIYGLTAKVANALGNLRAD